MQSSMSGLFVAGDCRVQLIRQTSNAVGDVTTAAVAAEKHLETQEEAKKQKRTFAAAA